MHWQGKRNAEYWKGLGDTFAYKSGKMRESIKPSLLERLCPL